MITIKDIAKEAQVSEGTVDRVLHDRGGVSQKTKEKVEKILEKHNFKVNPVARALAMKNKFKILTLTPNFDTNNVFWKSPYLGILKAKDEVENYGVDVENYFFNQFDPSSYLEQFNILIKSDPTAVIIVPTFMTETKQIVNQLEQLNIPYLFLNIDLDGFNNISFIGQDSYMGGYVAGKLMHLSLGKNTSTLVVHARLNLTNYHAISRRIEGFNDYFIKNNIKNKVLTLSIDGFNNDASIEKKINSFLEEHQEIKGVFVPSSRVATIANAINSNYLAKLQIIGFDNTKQNIESLATDQVAFLISQKPFEQGYESIHLMSDFLVKNKIPKNKIYSPIDILTKENAIFNERNETDFESFEQLSYE
ncbi:LacI family DNA-binding transcriptional regulator [Tamlana sp. I1]|uniref:LacI family DNA-binding transcriptional regulator n=1 Tax=Tamlana sp. I1 TaxID=2762061 RepID=UPI00188E96A2|nr:LacI family DNA-binding transcriptional regulator [Tamlana sp. I1]